MAKNEELITPMRQYPQDFSQVSCERQSRRRHDDPLGRSYLSSFMFAIAREVQSSFSEKNNFSTSLD
jgi:hypothetical protein